jgi:plasmid stability protein
MFLMPNLTVHLDDETHRLAKIVAATHRTSLSQVFRDHIRALAAAGGAGEAGPLERYARSEISAKEAMDALGLGCVEDLYSKVRARNLPLPRMSDEAARSLVAPLVSQLPHPLKGRARKRA